MVKRTILLIIAVCSLQGLRAQYYNNGAPPASQKWSTVRTDSLKMIFPRDFEEPARRTLYYMEQVRPYVSHGFSRNPLRTPVVMHTENFYSNGLGILAPKRIEISGLPAINTYASPWLKQLAAHEYRHMVQYANINRSTVKAFSFVLGQQASLLATGLLPFWFLEGDATMAETQLTEFGRGLQPSFTMHYRTAADELTARRNPDKWFCGSYRDYVPSHYDLGYQLVAHSERVYGKYIWDDVARYGSNYPFLLFTTQIALNKYYDTSTKKLFHQTFGYLKDHWASLPERDDSATTVAGTGRTYTAYEHPLFLDENTLLVLKSDYDRAQRFVRIDLRTGREEHLCYTGAVSSRPVFSNGFVCWTEYRSTLWEQRTNSVVCYMKAGEWKPRRLSDERAALYPTPMPDGLTAYVKYHYEGYYSIAAIGSFPFPQGTSIHGLAYDDLTDAFYYIALDDRGMRIGAIEAGDVSPGSREIIVRDPSKTTLSDLRAGGGKLYFGSIQSGYDEAHCIDLYTGEERRISTSRYGSFSPAGYGKGEKVAMTVYGRNGYRVATQEVNWEGDYPTIPHTRLPENIVNPPIADWGLPKVDELSFSPEDLENSVTAKPAKRYSKALNLFNFHSWMPADIDIDNIMDNFDFNDIRIGVTAMSQNLLSTALARVSYGYTGTGHSVVNGRFTYNGLPLKFGIDATWSDSGQRIGLASDNPAPPARGKNYLAIRANAYLPLVFSAGYHTRTLTPNVQYLYQNNIALDISEGSYKTGQHIIAANISWADNVRRARLDLLPRWGYMLRGSVVAEPARNLYMTTLSAQARVYTPGLFRHHGLSVAASYQKPVGEGYAPYTVLDILPRGCRNIHPYEYAAVSANYFFPIAYPDWGVSGIFFLKRIYASIGGDYAMAKDYFRYGMAERVIGRDHIWSYGGTLRLDIGFLRLPSQGTCTASFGVYVPSETGKPYLSVGFSIPL